MGVELVDDRQRGPQAVGARPVGGEDAQVPAAGAQLAVADDDVALERRRGA